MTLKTNNNLLNPRKTLNKAFLKVKPNRSEIEKFKFNLIHLLDQINDKESEEFHKNLIADFLKNTYYSPNHFVNTKGRNDLVIHNGKDAKSTVGVLIEAKSTTNKAEMLSIENINAKAFQELVLYYLRERITHKNLEIKHLVVTNIYEWFIFDAASFEKHLTQNKQLVKQFIDFEERRLSGTKTDFFYKEIAGPIIETVVSEFQFTHFDLKEYDKPLRNNDKQDDTKLIALFKLLSPEHLLKLPFTNDSNSLDKRFYSELLHIIGLTETKDGSKKLIERKKIGERNNGSLLENTIKQLDSLDKISRLEKPSQYGENHQERLFNVGLELVITWVNRILFLKLLEAQLISYHKGDKSFSFLNRDKIRDFDDLNSLFFQVLARKVEDRDEDVIKRFGKIPYLNSSLFEPTELEHLTLFVSNLVDHGKLPTLSNTVLKDLTGTRKTEEISTLEYLFDFLEAYDFAGEGSEEIQEDNKTLINASVLGLIFEKINGYKDGSFFTPGFITMYMCRETIRRAVLQKFNETKGWNCVSIDDLYDKIEDRSEANTIINSLKICDPAVGSGHFLVSALNEIIAIKNDLKVLQDRQCKRLKEYHVEVVNDELVVTDEDGNLFEYNPLNKESQRIQETLFHEKQTIIENCLFGVDINPNSVKICRLRLWIELLKNAYYKVPTNGDLGGELETLPNIDINIKCGNSLISRFALDADLKQALKKSKWNVDMYRTAVHTYRNAESKEQKREMERLIETIKGDFRSEINKNDPKLLKLYKLKGDLFNLTQQTGLFELGKKEKGDWNKKVSALAAEADKLETEVEEIKSNKIYENAFEWRFEFPEVLNNEGDFVGFDVVIGNPPYVFARENFDDLMKKYFYENYSATDYQVNLYVLFLERSLNILNVKANYSLIIPNSLLMVSSTAKIREFLVKKSQLTEIVNFIGESFEGVSVETITISGTKNKLASDDIKISIGENNQIVNTHSKRQTGFELNHDFTFNVFSNNESDNLTRKLTTDSIVLDNIVYIKAGLKAYQKGKGKPRQTEEDVKNRPFDYTYKYDVNTYKYLDGKNINRYCINWTGNYLRFGEHLAEPRIFKGKKIILREITGKYPKSLIATYTEDDYLFNMSNIAILPKLSEIDIKYILALISSNVLSYFFIKNTAKSVRKMFPKIILNDLRKFPIKNISLERQKPFIELVTQILSIKNDDSTSVTTSLEKEIDQLVYELYELTEEEIKIVEGVG
ncbi:type II restriction endonuclease [Solitalea longa]|uniref:site-specific DNA-methyltransferase (adenine-specific) n=1 Tax=Solitalea longa TaxID=2079460 RepID=A0A2S4ZXU3_9SPHI|nr:TaqI-like C-terminal specificity domain-containing protein [Solitalea longa]POY34703.1 type II restriction endonuclease [Solitalea longa]